MKTATHRIQYVFVAMQCPHCEAFAEDKQTGSQDICSESGYLAGEVETCWQCNQTYRVPAIARVTKR